VAFGGLLLLAGRLGYTFGHRTLFLAGMGLVALASLTAGAAPNYEVLVIGRVLRGAGAALSGPSGLALLTTIFEGNVTNVHLATRANGMTPAQQMRSSIGQPRAWLTGVPCVTNVRNENDYATCERGAHG
jgi:MFS family permease